MNEMLILCDWLTENGIEFEDCSDDLFARVHFTRKDGTPCSVVCGEFSYGGPEGFLETMPTVHPQDEVGDEVEGYLTANEIIAAWF